MRTDLVAFARRLKEGGDPFEPAFDAGVTDATLGRLYRETFRRNHHDSDQYDLGWKYGREAK